LFRGVSIPPPPPQASLEVQFLGQRCLGWSNETLGIPVDGAKVWMSILLDNKESTGSCVAQNVTFQTPGFTIDSSNTPVAVAAGTYGTLNFTAQTPSKMPADIVTLSVAVVRQ